MSTTAFTRYQAVLSSLYYTQRLQRWTPGVSALRLTRGIVSEGVEHLMIEPDIVII